MKFKKKFGIHIMTQGTRMKYLNLGETSFRNFKIRQQQKRKLYRFVLYFMEVQHVVKNSIIKKTYY